MLSFYVSTECVFPSPAPFSFFLWFSSNMICSLFTKIFYRCMTIKYYLVLKLHPPQSDSYLLTRNTPLSMGLGTWGASNIYCNSYCIAELILQFSLSERSFVAPKLVVKVVKGLKRGNFPYFMCLLTWNWGLESDLKLLIFEWEVQMQISGGLRNYSVYILPYLANWNTIRSFVVFRYLNNKAVTSLMCFKGVDLKKVDECIGAPDADVENPVLKAEQEAQVLQQNALFFTFVFLLFLSLKHLACLWFWDVLPHKICFRLVMVLAEMWRCCQLSLSTTGNIEV